MDLSTIQFGSLFSYSPHGDSDVEKKSRTMRTCLKNDYSLPNSSILTSNHISDYIKKNITKLPFAHFLTIKPILVPIPKSSLMQPDTLWVPQRLANALIRNGFGKTVVEYLERVDPLRKSATSLASNRPKAREHYNSFGVRKTIFPEPEQILLIDDVVTAGATIVGAGNKLHDAFPGAHIRAFAAMRTISTPEDFKHIYDPCEGKITLQYEETSRKP
jgi:hypothetical protein